MKPILFAFDFDQTLLQKNTDVDIQQLSPKDGKIPEEIHEIAKNDGWTSFCDSFLKYFHESGITKEQILNHIKEMPYIEGSQNSID